MCLDQLGRARLGTKHFLRGLELDPRGAFTLAQVGWHYAQLEDWAKVKDFTARSLQYQPGNNLQAELYHQTAVERLAIEQRR